MSHDVKNELEQRKSTGAGATGATPTPTLFNRRFFAKRLAVISLAAVTKPLVGFSMEPQLKSSTKNRTKAKANSSHYVLVHGAWLGGWCWDKVAAELKRSGLSVDAPDLPGHGKDQTPASSCTMEAYVDRIVQLIEAQRRPVILVGHSMAGVVISHVAERIPEKIDSLAYLAAYLLRSGETMLKAGEYAKDSHVGANMVMAPDYSTVDIKKEGLRDVFCADASDADADRIQAMYRPEPAAPFQFPVKVTEERWGKVPRVYIQTRQDHAVTLEMQRVMLEKTPCNRILSLESSHTPFFAKAHELAQQLVSLGSRAAKVS